MTSLYSIHIGLDRKVNSVVHSVYGDRTAILGAHYYSFVDDIKPLTLYNTIVTNLNLSHTHTQTVCAIRSSSTELK